MELPICCMCTLPAPLLTTPPHPRTKADFAAALLRRIWSLERRRYMLGGGSSSHRCCLGSLPPPRLKITVLMSLQNLCHAWICIIYSLSQRYYRCIYEKWNLVERLVLLGHLKCASCSIFLSFFHITIAIVTTNKRSSWDVLTPNQCIVLEQSW